MNYYRIFGLNIASELPLPSRAIPGPSPCGADLVIVFGTVPEMLAAPRSNGIRYQVAPGEFLLQVDNVARFYVRDGNRITISPEAGAGEEDILIFLMGSAMGALLHQRNTLVLHGSAIAVNGSGVAFCGPSGSGKSTLAAGFHRRGYPLLADDLCAIAIHDGRPVVIPGFPRLKLWADTLLKLDTRTERLQRVRLGVQLEKYFLPVDDSLQEPVPLAAVYTLAVSNTDTMSVTPLSGANKVDQLLGNTYRKRILHGLRGGTDHFGQCSAVAAAVAVKRVIRPDRGFRLDEMLDLLATGFTP